MMLDLSSVKNIKLQYENVKMRTLPFSTLDFQLHQGVPHILQSDFKILASKGLNSEFNCQFKVCQKHKMQVL